MHLFFLLFLLLTLLLLAQIRLILTLFLVNLLLLCSTPKFPSWGINKVQSILCCSILLSFFLCASLWPNTLLVNHKFEIANDLI